MGAMMREKREDKAGWKPALQEWLARAWWYIRQVSGDAAYENYLHAQRRATAPRATDPGVPGAAHSHGVACAASHFGAHDGAPLLSPREFYDDALRRRYSGVSRCC